MKVYTADDMLALLQQMHYAVGTGNKVIPQEAVRHAFVAACSALVKLVLILKKRVVKEAELVFFDEQVKRFPALLAVISLALPVSKRPELAIPKLHSLVHLTFFIRRYGAALNFDSGTFERFHREVVVSPYDRDCRREEGQLLRLYRMTNTHTLVQQYLGSKRDATEPIVLREPGRQVVTQRAGREENKILYHLTRKFTVTLHLNVVKRVVAEAFNCSVQTLPWHKFILFNGLLIDYGEETVRFACAPNYRKNGHRSDPVEVKLRGEENCPAEVICYFRRRVSDGDGGDNTDHALVQFYDKIADSDPVFSVPTYSLSKPHQMRSFAVVHLDSITGHAHMVQDIDFNAVGTNRAKFFWDKL